MAYDVKVNIDLTRPIGKIGFGIPLILLENAENAVPYTEVTSLPEIVEAGFAAESKVYKAAQLLYAQANAPKQIAICAVTTGAPDALVDPLLTGQAWRQLIVVNDGETATAVSSIIAAVEGLDGKMYFAGLETDDSTEITISGLRRTVLFYCDATEDVPVPVAALVGDVAGRAAGSFTYKNLILSGVPAQELTDVQIDAIHEKGGLTFVQKAGDNVTSEGKLAGGEYIDVMDCEDYVIQQLTYKVQKLFNNAAKVPYDNNGIAMIESVIVDVLQGAFNDGMIAINADGSPAYSVNCAFAEDTSEKDRAGRRYLGANFWFKLAGAIHETEITGTITA